MSVVVEMRTRNCPFNSLDTISRALTTTLAPYGLLCANAITLTLKFLQRSSLALKGVIVSCDNL
jgi:dethiobiotin synthetase